MKKILIAACCLAFVGGATAASAQMSNGMSGDSMSKSSMDANGKMMKKKKKMKMKKGMMKGDGMSNGDGMSKGMDNGMGMKKM